MNNNTNNQNNQTQNTDLSQFADLFSVELSEQTNPDSSTTTSLQSSSTNAINNPSSSVDSSNSVSNSNINSVENNTFATPSNPSNISDVNATTNASAGNNVNPTVSNSNTVPITPHSTSTPHPVNYGVPINNVIGVKNPFSSDQFLSIFIGPNCDKFANNVFSLPAFFFGPCYFFYRKLYLVGFIILILTNIFTNSLIGILVLGVVEGFVFYPIYRSWAMQKIDTIRTEKASLSHEEQRSFCIQAGGTSIPSIIMCFGINIVISLISFLISLIPIFS